MVRHSIGRVGAIRSHLELAAVKTGSQGGVSGFGARRRGLLTPVVRQGPVSLVFSVVLTILHPCNCAYVKV